MYKMMKPKAVTPSDSDREAAVMGDGTSAEYILVGTAGAVAFVLSDNTTWTAATIAAGQFLFMPAFRGILSTGTTAANIEVTRRY